jgi:phosphoribosylglycinamide formyltransferase-1
LSAAIVVLVSGVGSNLLALVDACERGILDARVVACMSDRRCRGLEAAAELGIPTGLVVPADWPTRSEWSGALRDSVLSHRPDLVVSAGFMRILAAEFVDAFLGRLINLHPSLLPAFPGAHAVRDALVAGVKVTGTTVHFVDREVDHGPILMQEPVRVLDGDTEETLAERIKSVEHRMIVQACRVVLESRPETASAPTEGMLMWT